MKCLRSLTLQNQNTPYIQREYYFTLYLGIRENSCGTKKKISIGHLEVCSRCKCPTYNLGIIEFLIDTLPALGRTREHTAY